MKKVGSFSFYNRIFIKTEVIFNSNGVDFFIHDVCYSKMLVFLGWGLFIYFVCCGAMDMVYQCLIFELDEFAECLARKEAGRKKDKSEHAFNLLPGACK